MRSQNIFQKERDETYKILPIFIISIVYQILVKRCNIFHYAIFLLHILIRLFAEGETRNNLSEGEKIIRLYKTLLRTDLDQGRGEGGGNFHRRKLKLVSLASVEELDGSCLSSSEPRNTVIRRAMANDGMPAIFKTFPLASDLLFLIHRASLIQRSGI